MQTKHLCVLIHIWTNGKLALWKNGLSPPVKYFYCPFQGSTSFVDHSCYFCLVFVMLFCLFMPCGHLLGKGWPLGSRLWCLIVNLLLSPLVSWVRCGPWLYLFHIFALFLTLLKDRMRCLRWGSNLQSLNLESSTPRSSEYTHWNTELELF